MRDLRIFFPILLAVALIAGGVQAETKSFKATLDGASEVPPTTGSGTGSATATLDTATGTLTWDVTYSGLSGPAMAAHIHGPAEAGKNAGVVVPFGKDVASPIKGSKTLTAPEVTDLEAGKYYVNIHTAANKGGEIRGQLVPAP